GRFGLLLGSRLRGGGRRMVAAGTGSGCGRRLCLADRGRPPQRGASPLRQGWRRAGRRGRVRRRLLPVGRRRILAGVGLLRPLSRAGRPLFRGTPGNPSRGIAKLGERPRRDRPGGLVLVFVVLVGRGHLAQRRRVHGGQPVFGNAAPRIGGFAARLLGRIQWFRFRQRLFGVDAVL